ncbi:ATP-binding protein [Bacteriovoracales bacterium]|nr:ATP-binding protein [Bacteriovoracales bacterium]
MKDKRNISIARKLIIYFVFSSLIIASIGTSVSLYRDYQAHKKRVQDKFKQIKQTILPSLGAALFNEDEEQIINNIKGIMGMPDVVYLEITRVYEGAVEDTPEYKEGTFQKRDSLINKVDIVFTEDGTVNTLIDPTKSIVGKLTVVASLKGVTKKIKHQIRIFIVIQAIQFFLVTIIMYALFNNLISKHLAKMSSYAEHLDISKLSEKNLVLDRSSSNTEDELDKVVGSFNIMKKNIKDSHEKLQDYAVNLEEKVFQRTEDLSEALKNIEYLLHNMKQSIFTVEENGIIEGPVSEHSHKIFETNIEGKNIFDTIFSCLDKKSETYASIAFANACNYGSDEVQWDMIIDQYPTRIVLTAEKFSEEKIIKVNYTPLWNKSGLLTRVMYIVEDITEVEKLEMEMKNQKEEATKNVKILQELGINKKEDLHSFFSNTIKLSLESQALAKEIRSQIEKDNSDIKGLKTLFRHLHTIKGNSRIYGLTYISGFVHGLENQVSRFLNQLDKNSDDFLKPTIEQANSFIKGLYDLHGELNFYLNSGREIFGLEFKEDLDFKEHIHKSMTLLELLIYKTFSKKTSIPNYKKDLNENPIFFKEIKETTHSLKGLARSLDEKKLSEKIHQFESGIEIVKSEDCKIEEVDQNLIDPFQDLTEKISDIYIKSSLFEADELKSSQWVQIFLDCFDITEAFLKLKSNRKKFIKFFYNLKGHLGTLNINFFNLYMELIQNALNYKDEDRAEEIEDYIKSIWKFLALSSQIDIGKAQKDRENKRSIYEEFCLELKIKGVEKDHWTEVLENFLENKGHPLDECFTPTKNFSFLVKEVYFELKKSSSTEHINALIKSSDNKIYFLEYLASLLNNTQKPWGIYVTRINCLQLMASLAEKEISLDKVQKPDMIEILSKNFDTFKNELKNLNLNNENPENIKFQSTFQSLFDQPVKYSFKKFFPVIREISETLNKKVNFKLRGDEGSLEKEKLAILNDAMIHIVRNALDHGIEQPDQRISLGKEEEGLIEIECRDEKNDFLEVILKDDGKGIDGDYLKNNAIKKGILDDKKGKTLSDEEKVNLIFLPNFSTKKVVSDLSGRGVGMDVVKNNLEKIKANLVIETTLNKGTSFIIRIPKKKVS